MRRPLAGMGIALVAGVIAAAFGRYGLLCLPAVWIIGIMIVLWTDSSFTYVLGLSVFFVVGFCRMMAQEREPCELVGEIQGTVYKVQEKEQSVFVYVRDKDGRAVLVIVKKEGDENSQYFKGQAYFVSGEAEAFSEASNPGQFDEKTYYESQGVVYKIWSKEMILESEGGFLTRHLRWLEKLKISIADFYEAHMSEEGQGVIKAAVLGDRSGFQEDLKEYYQKNGWMHLVVTSGLHLSFVAMEIYRRLRKATVTVGISTLLAVGAMLAYGYMTDFGDSMIRAMGVMLLGLIGKMLGRRTDGVTSLVLTAAIMLLWHPKRLFSVGFQLSFGAAFGMEFGQWMEKSCLQNKKRGWAGPIFVQAGIFIVTLPVILWTMYEIPVLGFFYNFFMIPLISFIVPLSFTAGIFGILLGKPGAFVGTICLKAVDGLLWIVHKLPSKAIVCGKPELWQMIIFIAIFVCGSFLVGKRRKTGQALLVFGCLFLLLLRFPKDQIIFMDVGQGDGICILTEKGQAVLVDGGSSDVKNVYKYRIEPVLKYYGVEKIQAWFLSHGDKDHVSGIEEALEKNRKIGTILLPDVNGDETLDKIRLQAQERKINVKEMHPGDKVSAGNFEMICLYPDALEMTGNKNDHSLVLYVSRKKKKQVFTMLLTGDIEEKGEDCLVESGALPEVDVLKAAHHGSSTGTGEAFLEKIQPEWTVISCGKDNPYGHPHKEVIERLKAIDCPWVSTEKYGAIMVRFRRDGYSLSGYKKKD